MLHGKTGRKIRKKKTKILHAMTEGEFNDTLTFALSPYQLDTVQFLLILCNKVSTFVQINFHIDYLKSICIEFNRFLIND